MPTVGFDEVNCAPVFGQKTGVKYMLGSTTAYTLQDVGGIWPNGETYAFAATVAQFDEGDLAGVAPACGTFSYAVNNGVSSDVVASMVLAHAMKNHTTVFAQNAIAMSHPGVHYVKHVASELDVEPSKGNVVGVGSGGQFINAFNEPIPGAAIQIGGVGGGYFQDGLIIDGVYGAGVAPGTGSIMMSALNTSAGSYVESAIVMGNQHGIKMNNASGHPVAVMTDTAGNFRVYGNTGFIFQKSSLTEGAELFSARDASGVESISAKIARGSPSSSSVCALRVNGQSVSGRSINAGGTINSNGADYAEYERIKDGSPKIERGQIVGFDADGLITTRFDEAVSFGVKTTDPSFVGGDCWTRSIGEPPTEPVFEELDISLPRQPNFARMRSIDALKAINTHNLALKIYEAEVNKHRKKWERKHLPPYRKSVATYEAALEAERQKWDRIAYCGKVPVNVRGASVGQWIVPMRGRGGGIVGAAVSIPRSAALDAGAVGRVKRILEDGRAEIIVTI